MADSILIVDDERGIRDTLRAVLEDEGFECETAATGEECLRVVERRAFGCVLLDVWLPGIDGGVSLLRGGGGGGGGARSVCAWSSGARSGACCWTFGCRASTGLRLLSGCARRARTRRS